MCSAAVLRAACSVMRISWKSICSGVAPISRANWISVWIFLGIRFRSPMRNGRMSCRAARVWAITITPSRPSTSKAGRSDGRVMGMNGTPQAGPHR
jgi:hypothetical protein